MSFIRPEARAALWRWREVLAGLAVALLGLSWIAGPGGLLGWTGWPVAAAGLALAVVGVQRARFRTGGGGPGIVLLDEGEITYMGPLGGGSVAAAEIERLTYDPTATPPHWLLEQEGRAVLAIPVNAEGAEVLFDGFSALPGLRTERVLAVLKGDARHAVVIWERTPSRPATLPLH
ncbi:hypothetical protein KQ247_07240 [Ruegeria pomeroyi]|uniref:Uncharacterized protein n=2 Tax=Ruegeria pomeroyi TaxID=89184 RepID=Q5LMD7_RUEPO|nr:hypothetical protein [Ruegeria pomeroyi]HCE72293.1 hypothetical protein [Ruegeria sp.]AAV96850.1 hypothetical protein SPO3627 [Ruegeria pomeroyi DSS-3]NVK96394.1 hypothetical protein [Ruegeria pomeroyi]NVL01740.1 hypothetical protein [Ruegeria pomeroyi]QWV10378.1 hypothetical protein KQ247_07240 [Ruegeria pomeroyi]